MDYKKVLKIILIVFFIALYWRFIYYPYHATKIAPLTLLLGGTLLFFIGFYAYFIEKSVKFEDVRIMYILLIIVWMIGIILMSIGFLKHGIIKGIDDTIYLVYKSLGLWGAAVMIILTYPSYLIILMGSYRLLEKEHIYLWIMIFLALIHSGTLLFLNYVLH